MTEQEFKDNISSATLNMRVAVGPEYYFWKGYLDGLNLYHNGENFGTEVLFRTDNDSDDLESRGYHLGLAGNNVQETLTEGKKGKHEAGLNGNYHKGFEAGYLEKMGVIYHGAGKWTLPKGAKIILGVCDNHPYFHVHDGDNWMLRMDDNSEWIVWSEDIPGISGPPWDNS